MLYETIRLALEALRRNTFRSMLTVLGVVIGVGAVIAMVTVGKGTTAKVAADLAKLGTNLLFVAPGQFGPGRASSDARPFTAADVDALREQLRGVRAVAPVGQKAVSVVRGPDSRNTTATGIDGDYLIAQDWSVVEGRGFHPGEIRAGSAVCLVGATVRRELFGAAQPVGRSLRVGQVACEVVGLLEAKGQSGFGSDMDDTVLMPLRAFQRRIAGSTNISRLLVAVAETADSAKVQADLERLLRERRKITADKEDDFSVHDMKQIVEASLSTTTVLTGLLGAVAAVSLMVGGIGIMNIMLVSVTERTREIGIRLAIGASEEQVMLQFLIEAVILALFGGVIGTLAGIGLAGAAVTVLEVPFIVDTYIIVLAFSFSAMVGIAFGYLPARHAARLDPIEALHHE